MRWPQPEPSVIEEARGLLILLSETRSGLIAFALYRSISERESAVGFLSDAMSLPLAEITLGPSRRNSIAALRELPPEPRTCVFIYDPEAAGPDAIGILNLQREYFREISHPVVFWLRPPELKELATNAPDFWSWSSGVFDFRGSDQPAFLPEATQTILGESVGTFDTRVLGRSISLYRGLIRDFTEQPEPDRSYLAKLNLKLGEAHFYRHDFEPARQCFEQALELSRATTDRLGEANTLKALGDLKVREDDLAGARADYGAALPLYREIHDRLGEANCRQGLANLARAEKKPEQAFEELAAALEIHLELRDALSVAGDLLYLGRIAQTTDQHALAILLEEDARAIYIAIGDRWGQALILEDQFQSFLALEWQLPALAALWQARTLYREIGAPSAAQADQVFQSIAEQLGPEEYRKLTDDLKARAAQIHAEAIAELRKALSDDELLTAVEAKLKAAELLPTGGI